jgi:hypothetical protein
MFIFKNEILGHESLNFSRFGCFFEMLFIKDDNNN